METIKHGLISALKGTKKKDHKYIERTGSPGHYKYIYELKDNVKKGITDAADKVKKGITDVSNKWKDGWTTIADASKKYTSDFIKNFGDMTVNDMLSTATANLSRAHIQNFLSTSVSKISSLGSGWLKKGQAKLGHKWIKRFGTPGHYRYVYPKAVNTIKGILGVAKDSISSVSEVAAGVIDSYAIKMKDEPKDSTDLSIRDIEEDVKNINDDPSTRFRRDGREINCAWCTMTYDLRRRGIDVQAKQGYGLTDEDIARAYCPYADELFEEYYEDSDIDKKYPHYKLKNFDDLDSKGQAHYNEFVDNFNSQMNLAYNHTENPQYMDQNDAESLYNSLVSQGEGARGMIHLRYMDYGSDGTPYDVGGHAMAYEVIDGRAIIIDGQTGEVYDPKDVEDAYKQYKKSPLEYSYKVHTIRFDQLTPNGDVMDQYVEPARQGEYYKEPDRITKKDSSSEEETHYNPGKPTDIPYKRSEEQEHKEYDHKEDQERKDEEREWEENRKREWKEEERKKQWDVVHDKSNPYAKQFSSAFEYVTDAVARGVPYATMQQKLEKEYGVDICHLGEDFVYDILKWSA